MKKHTVLDATRGHAYGRLGQWPGCQRDQGATTGGDGRLLRWHVVFKGRDQIEGWVANPLCRAPRLPTGLGPVGGGPAETGENGTPDLKA